MALLREKGTSLTTNTPLTWRELLLSEVLPEVDAFGGRAFAGSSIFENGKATEGGGEYYSNARWYDPTLGRFITEDPAKDGLNWYAYCFNNPLRYIDPTGLIPIEEAMELAKNAQISLDAEHESMLQGMELAGIQVSSINAARESCIVNEAFDETNTIMARARENAEGDYGEELRLDRRAGNLASFQQSLRDHKIFDNSTEFKKRTLLFLLMEQSNAYHEALFMQNQQRLIGISAIPLLAAALKGFGPKGTAWAKYEAAAARGATVQQVADEIGEWLGSNTRVIINESGDRIFLSADGTRRIRFDLYDPAPHTSPHGHVEEYLNGKWVKSGPIYPTDVPQN
jgi:RHS repeat-associated protein